MGVDFDALRKKLAKLSGNSRRNIFWRPQEDTETTVRLLSFPDNDGQPFKELYFYYNIGNNRGLLAPFHFGKPDPFQELITKLRDDGAAGDKAAYELAKKLYPKMRCFAPVLVRGEEGEGIRIWSFGKSIYESLIRLMLDEDYGDITDPVDGRDIKVVCTKPPGQTWAKTDVTPRGKSTPLSSDPKQVKEWMDNIPDIMDVYKLKSYDELSKIINDWLDPEGDDSDGTERGSEDSDSADASSSGSGDFESKLNDLDNAFSDLDL